MERTRTHILSEPDLLVTELENGHLEVRKTLIIDGRPVYHRHVISPGDGDANEEARVKALVRAVHTPQVITTYKAAEAERLRQLEN